jgi:hypothetical protein
MPSGLTTRTNDVGLFAFSRLDPGSYTVFVAALGHEPASRTVTVGAGAATDLIVFTLVPLPSDEPYKRTLQFRAQLSGIMWKLTPTCIYTDVNPLVKTCGGVRFNGLSAGGQQIFAGCPACETHTNTMAEFTPQWESIVLELTWQGQTGATGKGFQVDLNAPNITRGTGGSINQADPYTWSKAANRAPIQIRVDKDMLAERGIRESDWNNYENPAGCTAPTPSKTSNPNCDWFFRVFPAAYDAGIGESGFGPDYGVMYENVAEVYFSYFIRAKAPEGFTALPG